MSSEAGQAAKKAAAKAAKMKMNEKAIVAFIVSMFAIATIFTVFHMARRTTQRRRLGHTQSKASSLLSFSRKVKGVLTRKVPTFPSVGHVIVVVVYLVVNIAITFTNLKNDSLSILVILGARTAWMAIGNIVLLTFLSLKNTPLAYLLGRSYEQLNILHQVAGYTTLCYIILHAIMYSVYFSDGEIGELTSGNNIYGIFAGVSLLMLAFTGLVVRRWWYEAFYYLHITFWIVAMTMVGLHRPNVSKKIIIGIFVAAGIWGLDRLIRMTRLAIYSTNNSAKVTPLPNGGTRVTLAKPPMGAAAGKHCFLWIPSIRLCETHPFTIATTEAGHLEFVVASYDGFTRDLHEYAVRNPGASLKASIEGPYGAFPDPTSYNRVVLVAGGSGASFTFGVALDLLKKARNDDTKLDFIWMVKDQSYMEWFSHHLNTLMSDKRVTVQLFVTRGSQLGLNTPSTESKEHVDSKDVMRVTEKEPESSEQSRDASILMDPERSLPSDVEFRLSSEGLSSNFNLPIIYTRPDIPATLRSKILETSDDERVLVLGCGPEGLMTQVRNTTATCIEKVGPSVDLHCEQFGW